MILPTKKELKNVDTNPELTVIFGKPKSGKTTLISFLDDCLVVDFDNGSGFVSVASVVINETQDLKALLEALEAKDAHKYKYIVLDTATAMEELMLPIARSIYRATPMGKDFTGNILTLPNGAGYLYVREAFMKVLNRFKVLTPHLILLGHTKDKGINVEGKEVFEHDLDLSGKLGRLVGAKADAVGFLYRKENQTILNFKGGGDFIVEARPAHLRNKEFVMMTSDENGVISSANWDKIFITKKSK